MRLLPQTLIPGFLRPRTPRQATTLYETLARAARDPNLFETLQLDDTLDGRVEAIRLLGALLFLRLRRIEPNGTALWQDVLDLMMADIERGYREIGVGDVSIPKKMRRVAEGFYGRVQAYEEGLADQGSGEEGVGGASLDEALARNVWTEAPDGAPERLAAHVRRAMADLDAQADDALMRGRVAFLPAPPAHAPEAAQAGGSDA